MNTNNQGSNLPLALTKGFLVFDWEWDPTSNTAGNNNDQLITGVSFVDSNGMKKVLLLEDYLNKYGNKKAERYLLIDGVNHIYKYEYSFGWYTTGIQHYDPIKQTTRGVNADLVMLDRRLKANGFKSIIQYSVLGVPYIITPNHMMPFKHKHIDALTLYDKLMIKSLIYKNKYQNNLSLDNVARVIIGRGKYKGFSGKDFASMSIEDKRKYVLEDSQLLYDILAKNNFEVLKLMDAISALSKVPFDVCCRSGLSKLWAYVLDEHVSNYLTNQQQQHLISEEQRKADDFRFLRLYEYYNRTRDYASINELIGEQRQEEEDLNDQEDDHSDKGEKLQQQPLYLEKENDAIQTVFVDNGVVNQGTKDQQEQQSQYRGNQRAKKVRFEGGKVFDPVIGEHRNVMVVDVASLYPTMVLNYNLCFSTVNCDCCKHDPVATVSSDIVPSERGRYWVCRKFEGIFTKCMRYFAAERLRQKDIVKDKIMADGLKVLINSGYGVFGHEFFKYYNLHVALLVAAYGRWILEQMKHLAIEQGFLVIAGDTDSLFLVKLDHSTREEIEPPNQEIKLLIDKIKTKLNVQVKHEKTFSKAIIVAKKHYLGILEPTEDNPDPEPEIKGLEGIKTDRVEWVRRVFYQMVLDYKNNVNPIPKLRQAFSDLEQWNIADAETVLLHTVRLKKDPIEYKVDSVRKRLGLVKNLNKNESVSYYLADKSKGNYTFNLKDLSIAEYKKMLIGVIDGVLKHMGHDMEHELFGKISLMDLLG
jgi:DNA polymerase elongation subunit (family B)